MLFNIGKRVSIALKSFLTPYFYYRINFRNENFRNTVKCYLNIFRLPLKVFMNTPPYPSTEFDCIKRLTLAHVHIIKKKYDDYFYKLYSASFFILSRFLFMRLNLSL